MASRFKRIFPAALGKFLPVSVTSVMGGYSRNTFSSDLFAGLTVGVVALPLAMAFAMASGVGPEKGLVTGIVAGLLISLLGGSRYQIGGPTGAFVVVIYGVVSRHGYEGLAVATLMASAILVLLGLFRFGSVIKFIPYPVTTGFTAGIAVIIFSSQVSNLLGLPIGDVPADFIGMWRAYYQAAGGVSVPAVSLSAISVATLVLIRRYYPKLPGPILVTGLGAFAAWLFSLPVDTIESSFGHLPSSLPTPAMPHVSWDMAAELIPDAITIALLGAIESLMSCVVADGMTGDRHHSNRELVAQGAANFGSVIFGGIPATGAIARTATNIKSGAKTPVAGVIHAIALFLFMFMGAAIIVKAPLASLAAILAVVAWDMSEAKKFVSIFRAPRSDILVLMSTFFLTVLVNLNTAVQVGVVLASLLFVRRMVEVTEFTSVPAGAVAVLSGDSRPIDDEDDTGRKVVPEGVEVYEINGPFFFGVAERLGHSLDFIRKPAPVFILRMRRVPVIDATGMYALEKFHDNLRKRGVTLVLSGVNPRLFNALEKFGFIDRVGRKNVAQHIDYALKRARGILRLNETD